MEEVLMKMFNEVFLITQNIKSHYTGEDPVRWKGFGGWDTNHLHMLCECPGLKHFLSEYVK